MTMTSIRARRGAVVTLGAMTASAALVLGGLSSASAADAQFGPDDVAGFESAANYNQWHIGSVSNPALEADDSLTFNECSVTFLAPPTDSGSTASDTQLFRGVADGEPDTLQDLRNVFETLSVSLQGGNDVTLQIALSISDDDSDDYSGFTTIRNSTSFDGVGTFDLEGQALTSSRPAFGDYASPAALLDALEERFGEESPAELFGFGIVGEPGAVAESISALGDTAFFGTGDCLPEVPDEGDGETPGEGDAGDADAGAGDAGAGDDAADGPQAPTRPVAVDTGL